MKKTPSQAELRAAQRQEEHKKREATYFEEQVAKQLEFMRERAYHLLPGQSCHRIPWDRKEEVVYEAARRLRLEGYRVWLPHGIFRWFCCRDLTPEHGRFHYVISAPRMSQSWIQRVLLSDKMWWFRNDNVRRMDMARELGLPPAASWLEILQAQLKKR